MPVTTDPVLPELHDDPVAAVKSGLPVERFDSLRELLRVSTGTLLRVMNISASTLGRRRKEGYFKKNESERLMRAARLFEHAANVFRNEEKARRWLNTSHRKFGGDTPIEHAETEPGAHHVDTILGRIEYGIFS